MLNFRISRKASGAGRATIGQSHPSDAEPADRPVKILWIILSGVVLIAGIAIGTVLMIDSYRERALVEGRHDLENTVLLLSRHFDQQFEDYVDAQARLFTQMQIDEIASPDEFKQRMSRLEIHQLLEAEVSGTFGSNEIFVFGSDGAVVTTSREGPLPALNVADRAYFKAFKSNATSATNLAEPVRSRVNDRWTIVLVRRLTNANGVFLGVMTRRIDPYKFEKFFESVALGKSATIAMTHRRGALLARFPHAEGMIGTDTGEVDMFQDVLATSEYGTSRTIGALDGQDRLASVRQMRNFPIVIIATKLTSEVLADWREQTRLLIVVAGLLTIVIVAVFRLIGWRLSQERKLSEHRLALGKQRLDTALTNMSQGLCLFDASKRLVISNPRFRQIYGLTEEQSKPGTPLDQILRYSAANGDGLDDAIDVSMDVGSAKPGYTFELGDGRVIAIRRTPTPDGGWVSTHEDVTERERATTVLAERSNELKRAFYSLKVQKHELIVTTEALSLAKDAAEAASRAKSDFLAMMSHEVRTPMAGMMGMIDLLAATPLDEEQQDLANVAQESARNLLTVVNNILDFSKLEAGQLTPEAIDFSVKHSINGVAMLLGPKARSQGLSLETSLADDMPRYLNGDPSRIGQILLNLVGNAIKFTATGTVRIAASHRILADEQIELCIEVIDSGTGIPADVRASLFSPFTQADSSVSRKYGGTGLGLAICKQLCRAMGGDIGVESEPGRGSRFWFTVQCRPGTGTPAASAPSLVPAVDPGGGALNILVAEDNAIIRKLISKLLSRRGYRADLVCNGREALAAVKQKSYDLILMDMQMPEMDGISASKAIRSLDGPEREVPIVALTANALVGQREICLAAGMNDFLTKPIQPEALYSAILLCGHAKSGQLCE